VPQILRVGGHRTLLVSRVTGNLGAIFRLPRYSGTCELWAANLRNFRIADHPGVNDDKRVSGGTSHNPTSGSFPGIHIYTWRQPPPKKFPRREISNRFPA